MDSPSTSLRAPLSIPSLSRSSSSRINSLYEISYIPENQKIQESIPPILNPYTAFNRSSSSFSVKSLFKKSHKHVKEFIQTSSFDQCQIPASSTEQYVTLEIPYSLIEEWKQQDYTHIHFGAIRLALSYHGRKGLPVVARLALLDTRYPKFQHACIATIQSTMNAGTIICTTFPNFNMSLNDKFCADALKVQVQLSGAEQNLGAISATLHYQMVWRLQDHAIDLAIPSISDALMLTVDSENSTCCKFIPRQISQDELIKLLPESWVTSYDKTHQVEKPILLEDSVMKTNMDGSTTIQFTKPRRSVDTPTCFQTQFQITPAPWNQDKHAPPVHSFNQDGQPVYFFKDPESDHCYFGDCDCDDCVEAELAEAFDIQLPKPRRKAKRRSERQMFIKYNSKDPTVGTLGQPSGKYDYLVSYTAQTSPDIPIFPSWNLPCNPSPEPWDSPPEPEPETPAIMMFTLSSGTDFPDILETKDQKPKVINPQQIQPDGSVTSLSQAEAVLNWQTENARIQTRALQRIEKKVETLQTSTSHNEQIIKRLESRINQIHHELMNLLQTTKTSSSVFSQKEAEMKSLKAQLSSLQQKQQSQPIQTQPLLPSSLFSPNPWKSSPSLFPMTSQPFLNNVEEGAKLLYGDSSYLYQQLKNEQMENETRKRKGKSVATSKTQNPVSIKPTPTSAPEREPQLMVNPISSFLKKTAASQIATVTIDSENSQSEDLSESSPEVSEDSSSISEFSVSDSSTEGQHETPHFFMNTAGPSTSVSPEPFVEDPPEETQTEHNQRTEGHSDRNNSSFSKIHTFTLDDIPVSKWPERLAEFQAWMYSEMLKPNSTMLEIMKKFASRFVGVLKAWWLNLGEYRQLEYIQIDNAEQAIYALFAEFCGPPDGYEKTAREEFFKMKCCSLKRSDLEKHYKAMSQRYYQIRGMDDPNIKHAFLASFPQSLADETARLLQSQGLKLEAASIGQIYQKVLLALDKLCTQKEFFDDYVKNSKQLSRVCNRPDLKIKCKDEKTCSCKTKKKYHSRKWSSNGEKFNFSKKNRKFRKRPKFLRRKAFRRNTFGKCYLCGDKGHFAKQCPKNKKQAQKMIQKLQQITGESLSDDEIESIFSIDDECQPASILQINCYDNTESDSDLSEDYPYHQYAIQKSQSPQFAFYPIPLAPVKIFTSKYAKPIQVIAFIDTGAASTIINPKILPPSLWKPYSQTFHTANGSPFVVNLISKPIVIQIFPGCTTIHRVLGSKLPGRDMVLGFDVYSKLQKLRILPEGVRFKNNFLPWTDTPSIFSFQTLQDPTLTPILDLFKDSCAETHSEFKNPNPLWMNPEFFIKIPFKLNEDTNPTKASHSGMSPEHQKLALQECKDLIQQGLIEESNSQWACEAFYVNKRSEQNRGKLRLVVNYQPLNHFLQDIKFPIPSRSTMFANLCNAKVFSKFDLKAGFWQLGIHPDDRHKTGFCIPDHHYQWTVMPFGLKTAPSLFQKTMVKIFEPILKSALIYIDDILLYSPDQSSHLELLQEFAEIVKSKGIMLAEKKIQLCTSEIEFLGMRIIDGKYQVQPHISEDIQNFPDILSSKKQIQQFLGLINYIKSFIPYLSKTIAPLTLMLQDKAPPWTNVQTNAVRKIKECSKDLPPLKIPSDGIRILQTDASDEYWAAILFEEDRDTHKRHLCGYQSGKFKPSQAHYHSTFKEILAVKHGIEKFEIHLIGHWFQVESDMKSFQQMLTFKPKKVPHQQLLRWEEWFSKYNFTVRHIRGSDNFLADYLTRERKFASIQNYPPPWYQKDYNFYRHNHTPPLVLSKDKITLPQFWMITYSTSDIDNPPEFRVIPNLYTLNSQVKPVMFKYLQKSWEKHSDLALMLGVHPTYPFSKIFTFILEPFTPRIIFPQTLLWFFWCLLHLHYIAFEIPLHILSRDLQYLKTHPYHSSCIVTFLTWFEPFSRWEEICAQQMNFSSERWRTVILKRTVKFQANGTSYFENSIDNYDHSSFQKYSQDYSQHLRQIQKVLFEKNQVIPPEIWPSLSDDAPWEMFPVDPGPVRVQTAQVQPTTSSSTGPSRESGPRNDPTSPEQEDFWPSPNAYSPVSPRDYNPAWDSP